MRPARSSATIVFSNVGFSTLFAIRSISKRLSRIASSNAGSKDPTVTASKGGTPPNGPVQGRRSGWSTRTSAAATSPPAVPVVAGLLLGTGREHARAMTARAARAQQRRFIDMIRKGMQAK
jgi:hypothetical protein